MGAWLFGTLIPSILTLLGFQRESWSYEKMTVAIQSLIMIPYKRLKGVRRNATFVEHQYDQISGMYIKDNFYQGRDRYSVVDGEVKLISSVDNMRHIRKEMASVLSDLDFDTVLEVGVGELTTLGSISEMFGSDLTLHGVDLSLNRMRHGLAEYEKRFTGSPTVSKANAIKLPYADNTFDLVYTRHTLEQMPNIYQSALDEIIRVSRRHVVLFEPSFRLGGWVQKLKMLNTDYVRGISKFLAQKSDVLLSPPYLMSNSANPLNHTACYRMVVEKSDMPVVETAPAVVCPLTKGILERRDGYLLSETASRAYPIIDGIPVLDETYSFVITPVDRNK